MIGLTNLHTDANSHVHEQNVRWEFQTDSGAPKVIDDCTSSSRLIGHARQVSVQARKSMISKTRGRYSWQHRWPNETCNLHLASNHFEVHHNRLVEVM